MKSIDFIELCVADAEQSAEAYTATFGFRRVAAAGPETGMVGHRSIVLAQGDARMVLTSALSPESPVAEYVALHGEGVLDIAFSVDDVARAFQEAVARGAQPLAEPSTWVDPESGGSVLRATVASPAGVSHSLIQRTGGIQAPFLAHCVWDDDPMSRRGPMLSDIDHVAMCLEPGTLDSVVGFYEKVFGFKESHREVVDGGTSGMNSKVVQNESGTVKFPVQEPLAGKRSGGQIARFLRRHGGPGVQHVAFLTDDMFGSVRALESTGVSFLPTPKFYYDDLEERVGDLAHDLDTLEDLNVLVDRDDSGYLLQVFTSSAHDRKTLFFEVIERRGALGFGGANIRALFRAVADHGPPSSIRGAVPARLQAPPSSRGSARPL